ncbi:MAG: amidohydrolase family protein [Treponema sp.]|jgi:predicted TIM-barrel fold metal-dependent hydrolase|nr:amidohydrolase family protein [Treponema sp.]
MTDFHIHIGQFQEIYYEPLHILNVVSEAGVSHAAYSSVTSCKNDVTYKEVEREIAEVAVHFPSKNITPFFWYIPSYINEGITAVSAFQNLPYGGIKLHPRAHHWNLQDTKHLDCLQGLFTFSQEHGLPILIHTGEDEFEKPSLFESFFIEYPKTKCILAHCRPVTDTIAMFQLYKNVYGDTAFLSADGFEKIIKADFRDRIISGSDFPITHYFRTKYPQNENCEITLQEQYIEDLNKIIGFGGF